MLSKPRAMTTRPSPRRSGRKAIAAAMAASRAIGISTYEWTSTGVLAATVGATAAASPA
ncbi:MAG TPA: hypothetical protein VIY71_04225 [Solirubrobacterales bacterium]